MGKKIVSLFIAILMIAMSAVSSMAAAYFIIGDFKVAKNSDDTLALADYMGESSEVEVPTDLYGFKIATIEGRAFAQNNKITKMVLPDTLTAVGDGAFSDSTSLTEIYFTDSLKKLGSNAFYGCTKLKTVKLGNSIEKIPGYSFNRCSALTSFEVPASVKEIGDYAFFKCVQLREITIPSSVKAISDNAFNECNNLTIVGDANSYVQEYALAHAIPFRSTSGETAPTAPPEFEEILGDVDSDGYVTDNDARFLQMFCINLVDRSFIDPANSDTDGDGKITVKDVTKIQKYMVYGKF